ncbi:MAG TPA: hypothetical protein VFM02_02230 [Candidatus Paceibacterota bacterium]|nr:hypothetical protein [Candidatus Paceibacterota bacterium]
MTISWAAKRKFLYFLAVFLLIFLPVTAFTLVKTYRPPSCFDHKQNQGEEGPDCGGPCELLCAKGNGDLVVDWDRTFQVSDGVYNAVAYVENKNDQAGIEQVHYTFKIYDQNNILITTRSGTTFVNPGERFVIFEPRIDTKYQIPARTFLEFESSPTWERAPQAAPKIEVVSRTLTDADTAPRLTVTLHNPALTDISNIQVVAVVYDINGNAIGSSSTYIDNFPRTSDAQAYFTWPQPFSGQASRIEIIPRVNVFEIQNLD